MRRKLYIVDGYRTPFTKIGTDLANEPVHNLGISTAKQVISKTGLDVNLIDHVVYGCVSQQADAQNVARIIGVRLNHANLGTSTTVSVVHAAYTQADGTAVAADVD